MNFKCFVWHVTSTVLTSLATAGIAHSENSWFYVFPYDGTTSTGSWAQVKAFSEAKVVAYYAPQGLAMSCIWATAEPNPPQSDFTGSWGGTFAYQGTTDSCTGGFRVTWVSCPDGQAWVDSSLS